MTKTFAAAAAAMALALAGAPAPAEAQSLSGALKVCSWIEDDTSRLACFDRAVRELADQPAGAPVAVAPAPRTVAPAAPSGRTAAPAPAQPAASAPRTAAVATTPEEDFGKREIDRENRVDRVTARLVTARQAPDSKWVFTLDNGQVWRQIDGPTHLIRDDDQPEVVIKRAFLGSFLMSIDDGPKGLRVRREK